MMKRRRCGACCPMLSSWMCTIGCHLRRRGELEVQQQQQQQQLDQAVSWIRSRNTSVQCCLAVAAGSAAAAASSSSRRSRLNDMAGRERQRQHCAVHPHQLQTRHQSWVEQHSPVCHAV
jgi:hypothetical protein